MDRFNSNEDVEETPLRIAKDIIYLETTLEEKVKLIESELIKAESLRISERNLIEMKTPEEITQYVLDGMLGIGGCPSNEEFYAEFDDRLRRALGIANIAGQSEKCSGCEESTGETKLWCCNHCGKRIEDF